MLAPLFAAGASLIGNLFGQKNQQAINQQNFWAQNYQNQLNLQAARENQANQIAHTSEINERNIQFQREANAASMAQADKLNAMALADKERDRALQQDFAQMGIQWRVQDAEKAGVHPLFALGGGGAAYSPSAISLSGGSTAAPQAQAASLGSLPPGGVARAQSFNNTMGQDVSRAFLAAQSLGMKNEAFETAHQDLTLKNLTLRNDLLASQIAKNTQAGGAVGPTLGDFTGYPSQEVKEAQTTPVIRGGRNIVTNPKDSDAQTAEDRYDEAGAFFFGLDNALTDLHNNPGAAMRWFQKLNGWMIEDQMRLRSEAIAAGRHPSTWFEGFNRAVRGR